MLLRGTGSSIRDIKIISKDINFELWPHTVDTAALPGTPRTICGPTWHDVGKSILNQFLWGCAVCQVFSL